MNLITLPRALIFFLVFQIVSSTYDCVDHCACTKEDGVLTADCRGLNFTEVPSPDPRYMVNVLLFQFNLVTTLRAVDFFLYTELKELSMQGNRVEKIEKNAFDQLKKLEKLDLSNNVISYFSGESLATLAGSLRWISFSMNALRRVPEHLVNMTRLEHLDVSNNGFISELNADTLPSNLITLDLHSTGIKYFQKSALENLTSLETLLLSDNSASALVKFEQGIFDGLKSLRRLDLSRTFCKNLPVDSFVQLKRLETLIMNKCWLCRPPMLAKLDALRQEIDSGNNHLNTLNQTVTHSPSIYGSGYATNTQEYTYATKTPLPTVDPVNETWFNPMLTVLDLSNNGRMFLDPKTTRFSPSLLDLRLGHTNIPTINKELFKDSISIHKLDLSYAKLKTVDPEAFSNFRTATKIRLSGNPLLHVPRLPASLLSVELGETKMANLTRQAFGNLINTVEMTFSCSEVEWIEDDTFLNMTSLRRLDLSENKLDALQRNALRIGGTRRHRTSQLLELDLSENLLRSVEDGAFSALGQLRLLDLEGNFLIAIGAGLFQGLDSLVKLNLSLNSIVDITPRAFNMLSKLEELNLEDNDIEVLFEGTFSGMNSLSQLNLRSNRLVLVHPIDLLSLAYIDISTNNLTTLPRITSEYLLELKAANNPIEEITSGIFSGVPTLENVDLSLCQLAMVDYSSFKEAHLLRKLDLTGSNIETFVDVTMPSLENLILESNNIQAVNISLKHVAPKLKTLKLGYNNISYLNPDVFSGMSGLSKINLYGDSFQCDCNLRPLVEWIKRHISIVENAEYYTCAKSTEYHKALVLKTVSGLHCAPSSGAVSSGRIYVPIAIAVAVLAVILISLLFFVRKKFRRERQSSTDERNGVYRDGTVEVEMNSKPNCCLQCRAWCVGSSTYRRRADTEERRDLMISSPVTSPSEKEAPALLE